jgi:hypothetical protein
MSKYIQHVNIRNRGNQPAIQQHKAYAYIKLLTVALVKHVYVVQSGGSLDREIFPESLSAHHLSLLPHTD